MTCSKGVGNSNKDYEPALKKTTQAAVCKYSHDYILTPEQLAMLACNAKKAPCNWLKNGKQLAFLTRPRLR